MLALQVIIAPVTTAAVPSDRRFAPTGFWNKLNYHKDVLMNKKVYGELDGLYEGFMSLTADRQTMVVESAQSLLEAQGEIESLVKKTGTKAPLPTAAGKKSSHEKTP
jgi:hypothetical protein